jgi:type I restriction enzyme, S subunit
MSELPRGWEESRLGDIVELRYGSSLPEKTRVAGSFQVFGSNGPVGTHNKSITNAPVIIVGRKGSIGEVHYTGRECFPIDTTFFVDRFDACEPRFVLHLLQSLPLKSMNRATAIPGLNREDAYALPIYVPPFREQRRIVAKIDNLRTKSGRARDHLDHLPRLVEKYKQAVLAAAFRGDLTREWKTLHRRTAEWTPMTIGDALTDIRYGTAKKCSYGNGATPVLRIPNIQLGRITVEDLKFADFDRQEVAKLRLDLGDILIIRSNGSLDLVGRSAVVNQAALGMLFAGYLIRLRLDKDLADPTFINLYFMAAETRAKLETLAKSTSGVNNINSSQLQALPLLLPEVAEQNEIVRRVERAFVWIDRLATEATNARKLLDHLDQAVLAKAFRGELVPQDPNDEPASVLLERIRAESATIGRAISRSYAPQRCLPAR